MSTAAGQLALEWTLDHIPKGRWKILDFGARYSPLPRTLYMSGHDVTAYDRDTIVLERQPRFVNPTTILEIKNDLFDITIANWAIQHNELPKQKSILKCISKMTKRRIIITSSLSPTGETFYQGTNVRKDPQWVLSFDDHMELYKSISDKFDITEYETWEYNNAELSPQPVGKANSITLSLTNRLF